ncbi:uncharacterized protein HD556DRAFT_662811 [Suillus plorans]|uniref:Uncharacterized protein n=1 Tax=Suillus plorans TaxID=116603 RepID=A0A9P7ALL2_9AGAM|nr:uncharacterized protein HD556DRAFT_662811 [Suillus plorans]KAG1791041.1 hypothetical protein HD556DRAFT_662811 [Suillus plorans]
MHSSRHPWHTFCLPRVCCLDSSLMKRGDYSLLWLRAGQGEMHRVVMFPFGLVLLPSAKKFQEPIITQPDFHASCLDDFRYALTQINIDSSYRCGSQATNRWHRGNLTLQLQQRIDIDIGSERYLSVFIRRVSVQSQSPWSKRARIMHRHNSFNNNVTRSPSLTQRKLAAEFRPSSPLVGGSPVSTTETHQTVITKNSWLDAARESTNKFKLNGSPLPLVWVLVEDNVIPPNAVPFGEDKNGSQLYIARALLEVGCFSQGYHNSDLPYLSGWAL